MYHYLYQITNLVNGKIYVGVHKTKNLNDGYMGSGKIINRAIMFYGINNFRKDILEFFENQELMYSREKEIVNKNFIKLRNVYNLKCGGDGGWDHENLNSEKQRRKGKKGNSKQIWLRENNPEWKQKEIETCRRALSERIKNGELIGFMNLEIQKEMSMRALSPKARLKRKKTFKERGHAQGSKNSQFGIKRIGINKNGIIKKVLVEDVDKFINDDWKLGFVEKKIRITKTLQRQINLKEKILLSKIDVTQKGWPVKMSKEVGCSRTGLKRFIAKYLPELYNKCFIETYMIRK